MARADILSIMYNKEKSPLEFHFDTLMINPMLSYITLQDIEQLKYIATSVKLSSKINKKYKMIDDILTNRGFRKVAAGTNRVVYRHLEDTRFVLKVAVDRVGMKDNPNEYKNQMILKPFVTKVFEVSPCGTVATVERVQPIMSKQEFYSVSEDIFDLLNLKILGRYVLEDIGSKFFMNWGLRDGFGPVLLDFPYLYELEESKLYCNKILDNGEVCNGLIDYDFGFNKLVCTKCGKTYFASELKKSIKEKSIIVKGLVDDTPLRVKIVKDGKVIKDTTKSKRIKSSDCI